ncbi:hypothetical protein THASP1DRAFT_29400 [Thamnocephalis sphaerospora]|uniref:Uncharacterized protein n=1 Tax=Thamnocephalis sphaerospora TaxID=78915 RepID=A0A4V1IWU7_9FUNG|nr:hypothetical protein THASP1DRAFT_29400 [Thamnocephalis sphaerospora]|eukprot:RKP08799.1 hypothetical protein THASP1DRAFT_29400 [Thamnocephalis sphaerospora]
MVNVALPVAVVAALLLAVTPDGLAQSSASSSSPTSSASSPSATSGPVLVSNQTGLEGASSECLAAFKSSEVQASCANMKGDDKMQMDQMVANMCNSPADGAAGHLCSTDQINKALDILESKCQNELKQPVPAVQTQYVNWLVYTLNSATFCAKAPSGKFCVLEAMSATTSSESTPTCDACTRSRVELMTKWTPSRSPGPAADLLKRQSQPDAETARSCGIKVSAASPPIIARSMWQSVGGQMVGLAATLLAVLCSIMFAPH